jgi:hypothetical protein
MYHARNNKAPNINRIICSTDIGLATYFPKVPALNPTSIETFSLAPSGVVAVVVIMGPSGVVCEVMVQFVSLLPARPL